MILRKRRFAQGSINLELPEIKLDFDKDGRVSGAHEQLHDESHQIVEEFMLAANVAVATSLSDKGIDFMRRVHGDPSEAKMQAFAEFVESLGFKLKNPQSRPELQQLIDRVSGQPHERAVNYALLRSFKQAEYSPFDLGHYALAVQNYCHFTSPIRRYPDLTVHRWIDALLTGNRTYRGSSGEELLRLSRQCSATERRAASAERELINVSCSPIWRPASTPRWTPSSPASTASASSAAATSCPPKDSSTSARSPPATTSTTTAPPSASSAAAAEKCSASVTAFASKSRTSTPTAANSTSASCGMRNGLQELPGLPGSPIRRNDPIVSDRTSRPEQSGAGAKRIHHPRKCASRCANTRMITTLAPVLATSTAVAPIFAASRAPAGR